MAGATNVIVIKGPVTYDEANADAAITPGHLIERTATGVKVHATADGEAAKFFAGSDPSNSESWDTAYATGERVSIIKAQPGAQINAILADSNVAVVDSPLVSNGNGQVKVATVGAGTLADAIVGRALEAVTTSGAVSRIKIEVT